jgi:hypothetical protein
LSSPVLKREVRNSCSVTAVPPLHVYASDPLSVSSHNRSARIVPHAGCAACAWLAGGMLALAPDTLCRAVLCLAACVLVPVSCCPHPQRPHTVSNVVVMNLKGRFVPPTGGREYPVECNMMFNVSPFVF